MKLNKNDIQYILRESINKIILNESTSVSAAHRKYFSSIDDETYDSLVRMDPTYNETKPDVMGKYGLWILNQYRKGAINNENMNEVGNNLKVFTKFINRIENKNIQSYKNPEQLQQVVQPFIDDPNQAVSKRKERMKVSEGAENVYEDRNWVVIVPHTWEASKKYGAGTSWCTKLKDSDNYFEQYSSMGPLYIVINKKDTDEKYQIHFESDQFKDKEDTEVRKPIFSLHFTDGLIDFFDTVSKNTFSSNYMFEKSTDIGKGSWFIETKDGNFLKKEGAYIKVNFDRVKKFIGDLALVTIKKKYNFINTDFQVIYGDSNNETDWFDEVSDFVRGVASVHNSKGWNYLTTDGNLKFDYWFDNVEYFNGKYVKVEYKGKSNLIDSDYNFVLKNWYDYLAPFGENLFEIIDNGRGRNLIDKEENLLCDEWFNYIDCFRRGFAIVVLRNGKRSFINKEGKLLSKEGFYEIGNFNDKGYARIYYPNTDAFKLIDTNGNVTSPREIIKNRIDNGEPLTDIFERVGNFRNGYAKVCHADFGQNLIDTDGNIVFDKWFYQIGNFRNGYAMFREEKGFNFIDKNGKVISEEYFSEAYSFDKDGYAEVEYRNEWYLLDTKGNLYDMDKNKVEL